MLWRNNGASKTNKEVTMGSKYTINYRQYDEYCGYEYQTKWLIVAIYKFIKIRMKYELVDFSYRK